MLVNVRLGGFPVENRSIIGQVQVVFMDIKHKVRFVNVSYYP